MRKRRIFKEYSLIVVGSATLALAITWFSADVDMVIGGFAGLAIIIRHLSGLAGFAIPVFVSFVVLNIPLFIIAAMQRGWRFIGKSVLSVSCVSATQALLEFLPSPINLEGDYLIAAIMFGAVAGLGTGMVFSAYATTGGSDTLATIIKHKIQRLSTVKILLTIDAAVILIGAIIFSVRLGMYAVIAAFIFNRVITYILEGLRFSKAAFIVSKKHEEIAAAIGEKMHRGSTSWATRGMYTGERGDMLYVVIGNKQAAELRKLIYSIDPHAFVTLTDVREVLGEGFLKYDEKRL